MWEPYTPPPAPHCECPECPRAPPADISAMVPSVASGEARLVGLALLCPVPPGGNGPTISRMIWGRPALPCAQRGGGWASVH